MKEWCDQNTYDEYATIDTKNWVGNFILPGLTNSDDDPFVPLTKKPSLFQRLVMRVVMGWKWDDSLG